jgi:hypothetical protein
MKKAVRMGRLLLVWADQFNREWTWMHGDGREEMHGD